MDLVGAYDSDASDDNSGVAAKKAASATTTKSTVMSRVERRALNAAPSVSIMTRRKHMGELIVRQDPDDPSLAMQPVQGPQVLDPAKASKKPGKLDSNHKFDGTNFSKQRVGFQNSGEAVGPDNQAIARTTLGYTSKRLEKFQEEEDTRRKRAKMSEVEEKEPLVLGSDDEVEYGVWGPPSKEERLRANDTITDVARFGADGLTAEQLAERAYLTERDRQKGIQREEKESTSAFERLMERKMSHLLPPKISKDGPMEPKTQFFGKNATNYKGQSWITPPAGLASVVDGDGPDMDDHQCFVPKKCVHRFPKHDKGVQRIRLFPKTGHLLLSGGLDGKCNVYNVDSKQLMRTYEGHTAAVRDVQFNHDGSRFVSASFDRYLRLWSTESGEVLQTFTNGQVPYVVEFYPEDDNFFVVGYSDNRIVTYDCTTGEVTQEYNHHLAPVNAIVFVEDQGTKMVTSSDDKKVLVWEWDIGVPIKYISDPTMHSMPSMTVHPSGNFIAAQTLDNHVAVLQGGGKFAVQKKKKFSGHNVAGYACNIAFSPDGRFMTCGDGNGKIYFWDWKKARVLQKYRAHEKGPAIGCVWHPLKPSVVFSCGWDGVIKMWQ
mmetsp:Transcript_14749/g.41761  ORF Transcript_14749/g.41761 Transcript_14749/m.41761 type:complete len:602 (-) Transcript_14749:1684-3489(-)